MFVVLKKISIILQFKSIEAKTYKILRAKRLIDKLTLPLIRIGINKQCNKCKQCPMYGFGIKKSLIEYSLQAD